METKSRHIGDFVEHMTFLPHLRDMQTTYDDHFEIYVDYSPPESNVEMLTLSWMEEE
jgi:hypothetical protein